jgi:hydrogenase nickel incorporation protein HypB
LFIENVGNLICPAEYDLGEDLRVVVFSVTEGEDKPLKYPLAFNTAQLAVITKIDIADAVGFDRDAAYASIRDVNPGISILETSARTGAGIDAWIAFVETLIDRKAAARELSMR